MYSGVTFCGATSTCVRLSRRTMTLCCSFCADCMRICTIASGFSFVNRLAFCLLVRLGDVFGECTVFIMIKISVRLGQCAAVLLDVQGHGHPVPLLRQRKTQAGHACRSYAAQVQHARLGSPAHPAESVLDDPYFHSEAPSFERGFLPVRCRF